MRALLIALAIALSGPAIARWQPQFSRAPLNIQKWYHDQHNAQGQWCCDKSDGHPYYGNYTVNADGSVVLDLKAGKVKIPSFKVLTGPNPTGHAVWWYSNFYDGSVMTYCFALGPGI